MKNLALILCFVLSLWHIQSQEKTIKGTITTDFDGIPLQGATVIVKGTNRGTQTNVDGKYAIKTEENDVLTFSYIGYKTISKTVKNALVINVVMVVDDASLEEVVVMGYGTQRKINRTSSIAVSSDEKSKPSATISQALSGKVAGLNVRTGSGQPGPAKSVNIRPCNLIDI